MENGRGKTGLGNEEVERNFKEALEFHLEGLCLHGEPIPEPRSDTGRVVVMA